MGNLRAEQRADVNGKVVTRHVRDTVNQPVPRSAIPAPVATSKPAITKARRPIYTEIMSMTGSFKMTAKDWNIVRENLVHLTDEELSEVQDVMNDFAGDLRSVNQNFMKVAIHKGYALNGARAARSVYQGAVSAGFKDYNRTLGGVLLGAVELKMLNEEDWSIPEGRGEAIRGKLLATQAIIETMPEAFSESVRMSVVQSFTLRNHELGNLIEESPDRSDDIVQAIQTRHTADAGTIRELINHDVKSLMNGVL